MSENETTIQETQTEPTPKTRIFIYNGNEFKDPGEQFSIDDVKTHLTQMYPEIARCKVDTTETETEIRIEFVKQAGTKGESEHACHCTACENARSSGDPTKAQSFARAYLDLHGDTPENRAFVTQYIRIHGGENTILIAEPLPDLDMRACSASSFSSLVRCPSCGASLPGAPFADHDHPNQSAPCPICGKRMIVCRIEVVLYIARADA